MLVPTRDQFDARREGCIMVHPWASSYFNRTTGTCSDAPRLCVILLEATHNVQLLGSQRAVWGWQLGLLTSSKD